MRDRRPCVLGGVTATDNIFYLLCPSALLPVPLVALATVATIIASQSIITGAFSMTRRAIQLGWLPPLRVKQTSAEGYGQIYIGTVNWMLMLVTHSGSSPSGFRQIRQSRGRLWDRRVGDDADDLRAPVVHRDAQDLALEPGCGRAPSPARSLWWWMRQLPRRQLRQELLEGGYVPRSSSRPWCMA